MDMDESLDFSRLTFDLSYKREKGRRIWSGGIEGRDIVDAYKVSQRAPGEWAGEAADMGYDPVLHVLRCGVNEAVHEALEWARLDGRPILDPHGYWEGDIFALVDDLVGSLFDLAIKEAAADV
jgi:hypothetical protein